MKFSTILVSAGLALSSPAFAEGDIEAGKKTFKKCKSCHMIADGDNVILKGGKTGPNLYGIIGKAAGTQEGFKYSKSLLAAAEAGLIWDEEQFSTFVQNPSKHLKAYLDDSKAKSKMTLKLKKGMEDVYAYLASVAE